MAEEISSTSQVKKKPEDFIFGKVIGEGSYSTVFLAKEVSTGKQYAMKVLEKAHIIREKKTQYVHREKEVFAKLNHPFFVKLYFTFQDKNRLYFGLSYAPRGELLDYINKLGCFDVQCTRFYAAEIVLALEELHRQGIIHRDLKPENILLSEDMHIQITDFGSAKILNKEEVNSENSENRRKNSFVGTAQYVSPEILNSKCAYLSSDLWALGCIIYQLLSGQLPFWGGHEYQIFQKILKLDYEFPDGFPPEGRDLVEQLLVVDPTKRIGCPEMGGIDSLKRHRFFDGIDWEKLHKEKPPELLPYLPMMTGDTENLWSQVKTGLDDTHISRLINIDLHEGEADQITSNTNKVTTINNDVVMSNNETLDSSQKTATKWLTTEERMRLLKEQTANNEYHRFVEGNLILKQGLIDKRKGLFSRRRMFLLTEGPHIYYVDPQTMVFKGQIPWSKALRPEAKNFKIFFVHTPKRTYYLEDPEGNSLKWCKRIEEVWQHYYGNQQDVT